MIRVPQGETIGERGLFAIPTYSFVRLGGPSPSESGSSLAVIMSLLYMMESEAIVSVSIGYDMIVERTRKPLRTD